MRTRNNDIHPPHRVDGFGVGLTSTEITKTFELAVQDEIMEFQQKGLPVARYDAASNRIYLEHADGARE